MKTVLEKVHKNKPRVQKASGAEGESKLQFWKDWHVPKQVKRVQKPSGAEGGSKWQFWKDLHMPKQVKQLLKGKKDGKGVDQTAPHSSELNN